MTKYPHLTKINKKFYFRRRIPIHLVEIMGMGQQFKKSLKTSDETTAYKRYAEKLVEYNKLCEEAERQLTKAKPHSLDKLNIDWTVQKWFRTKYQQVLENDTNPFESSEQKTAYIKECLMERDFWKRGNPNRIAADLGRATDQLLIAEGYPKGLLLFPETKSKARQGVNVDRTEAKYLRLEELVRKALIELSEQELIRIGVRFDKTPTIPLFKLEDVYKTPKFSLNEKCSATNLITLEGLIQEFFEEASHSFSDRMRKDMEAAFSYLIEIVGSKIAVNEISRKDFKHLRDLLSEMPTNARKLERTNNFSLQELVEDGKKYNRSIMKPSNVKKRLSSLKRLMSYAMVEGYIDKNPMEGIVAIDKNPEAKQDLRHPFSNKQLTTLFKTQAFYKLKPKNGHVFYWVPLVALTHGFRLKEILQLKRSDIKKDEKSGIIYIKCHNEGENSLKTNNSVRNVPLSPELVKLGFMQYVQTIPKGLLFDSKRYETVEKHRNAFSKAFSRYLKKHDIKTEKTSFHSFRHNFKDAMRAAAIPTDRQSALGGWRELGGVQSDYGSGFTIAELAKEIEKVKYPELDLSHLYIK